MTAQQEAAGWAPPPAHALSSLRKHLVTDTQSQGVVRTSHSVGATLNNLSQNTSTSLNSKSYLPSEEEMKSMG